VAPAGGTAGEVPCNGAILEPAVLLFGTTEQAKVRASQGVYAESGGHPYTILARYSTIDVFELSCIKFLSYLRIEYTCK